MHIRIVVLGHFVNKKVDRKSIQPLLFKLLRIIIETTEEENDRYYKLCKDYYEEFGTPEDIAQECFLTFPSGSAKNLMAPLRMAIRNKLDNKPYNETFVKQAIDLIKSIYPIIDKIDNLLHQLAKHDQLDGLDEDDITWQSNMKKYKNLISHLELFFNQKNYHPTLSDEELIFPRPYGGFIIF